MKTFPILQDRQDKRPQLASIPWAMIEPHRGQAERNHYQTLERLAERGGLSEAEALLVLDGIEASFKTIRPAIELARTGELTRRVQAWEAVP